MQPEFWTPGEYRERLLRPLGEVTNAMERCGCVVDRDRLREIADRSMLEEAALQGELLKWAGREVNWSSWQQLAAFLHTDHAGLKLEPSPYWKKGEVALDEGEIKTDDRALEWLAGANPEHREGLQAIRLLRKWQRTANYSTTWLDKALPHGDGTWRLYPSFGLGSDHDTRPGAKTGRFAVKNPQLNQVPRKGSGPMGTLRSAFVCPPGMRLVIVDYSQLEIVLLAHLCAVLFGDGELVRFVREGKDIHGAVARRSFGELGGDPVVAAAPLAAFKEDDVLALLRFLAKAIIYGNNYGKQRFGSSVFLPNGEALGDERSELLLRGLREQFPQIPGYQAFIRAWIEEHQSIISLFGRLMPLEGARARKLGDRNRAWRQALNFPMQAGGQEIMALALIRILHDPELASLGFVLSLVVHDEIVGWAPEHNAERALARVRLLMTSAVELLVPLQATGHTGSNWSEAK